MPYMPTYVQIDPSYMRLADSGQKGSSEMDVSRPLFFFLDLIDVRIIYEYATH